MDKKVWSSTSALRLRKVPIKWRIENFRQIAQDWAHWKTLRSIRYNLGTVCCGFTLVMERSRNENGAFYEVYIDCKDLKAHLQDRHHVLSTTIFMYVLTEHGEKRKLSEWRDPDIEEACRLDVKRASALQMLNRGTLEVRLDFEMYEFWHRKQEVVPKSVEEPKLMGRHLEALLEDGLCSDFVIEAKGETFKVHKNILAVRSAYFNGMFMSGMEECKHNVLKISTEAEVVRKFVRFIYTNKLHFDGDKAKDEKLAINLLELADMYQVDEIKPPCEVKLIEDLSTDNIVEMLKLAHACNADELRASAIEFMRLNKSSLSTQDDFQELISDAPKLGADILSSLFKIQL